MVTVVSPVRTIFKRLYLYISVILLNLLTFTIGLIFAWASPCIPVLHGSEGVNPLPHNTTYGEESWLVSINFFGAMLGNVLSMLVVKRIGRKKTILILTLPAIAGYLTFIFGSELYIFLIGRFLCGVTLGVCFQLVPVYIAEISETKNRGAMGSFFAIALGLGHLFTYAVGPFVTFQLYNIFCVIFPVLFIVLVAIFVAESPNDYIIKGDLESAEKILKKLRPLRSNEEVQKELEDLIETKKKSSDSITYLEIFRSKPLRKGLVICSGVAILQQFSAINGVVSYMQTIFDAVGGDIPPKVSPIIVGVVQVISTLINPHVIDKLGRKIILYVSEFMLGLSLTGLGTYFYLKESGEDVSAISWLPLVCLIAYTIFFSTGVGSILYIVMGELFPNNAKNVAATISIFLLNIFAFIVTWLFPYLLSTIEAGITFWIVAVLCFLGFLFGVFVVPETKGKTFAEIQEILNK